jgi:predicted dehydrogenase
MINVAVVGINGRGGLYGGYGHTATFTKIKNSRVVAICDADENLFPKAIADIEQLGGNKPKTVVDYSDLLNSKDIDAISISSPDYWHALHSIWACQAGKDVFVEKPLAYNIDEGRKMVQAARKYNRIVQVGTQHRSNRISRKAIELLNEGIIGDIYMGRATVYGHRGNIGRVKDSSVPAGVNWDLYRGPAPYPAFQHQPFSL